MKNFLKVIRNNTSKKMFMAIVTGILVVLNQGLGWHIPQNEVMSYVGVVAVYIFGQAHVDAKLVEKGIKKK